MVKKSISLADFIHCSPLSAAAHRCCGEFGDGFDDGATFGFFHALARSLAGSPQNGKN